MSSLDLITRWLLADDISDSTSLGLGSRGRGGGLAFGAVGCHQSRAGGGLGFRESLRSR